MKSRIAFLLVAMAIWLSGCASYPTAYRGDFYDGDSYYAEADDGYGDYYYAPEPRYDQYSDFGYGYGFGSSLSAFGWCAPYDRFCPSLWYSHFGRPGLSLWFGGGGFYDPWYGYGHGYGYWPPSYYGQHYHRSGRHDDPRHADRGEGGSPEEETVDGQPVLGDRGDDRPWRASAPGIPGRNQPRERMRYAPSAPAMQLPRRERSSSLEDDEAAPRRRESAGPESRAPSRRQNRTRQDD